MLPFAGNGQLCLAQANQALNLPKPPPPTAKLQRPAQFPLTAFLSLIPNTKRTPESIPLLLNLHNNTEKPIRVLNMFTPQLFIGVVRFDLSGANIGLLQQDLFGLTKVSMYSWQHIYITIKPHQNFKTRFNLAQMTLDHQSISPGKYSLSGFYGANMGYYGKGSGDDVFQGEANLPPLDLTVEQSATSQNGKRK